MSRRRDLQELLVAIAEGQHLGIVGDECAQHLLAMVASHAWLGPDAFAGGAM